MTLTKSLGIWPLNLKGTATAESLYLDFVFSSLCQNSKLQWGVMNDKNFFHTEKRKNIAYSFGYSETHTLKHCT